MRPFLFPDACAKPVMGVHPGNAPMGLLVDTFGDAGAARNRSSTRGSGTSMCTPVPNAVRQ